MKKFAILAVLSALAAGCANPQAATDATPRRERAEATTGSNIPRKIRPAEAPAPRDPAAPSSGTAR